MRELEPGTEDDFPGVPCDDTRVLGGAGVQGRTAPHQGHYGILVGGGGYPSRKYGLKTNGFDTIAGGLLVRGYEGMQGCLGVLETPALRSQAQDRGWAENVFVTWGRLMFG